MSAKRAVPGAGGEDRGSGWAGTPRWARAAAEERVATGAWRMLAALVAVQVAVSYLQYGVPVLLPFLRPALGLNGPRSGALAVATQAGSALALIAAGRAAERWGERRMLACGLMAAAGCTLLAAHGNAFLPVFLALGGAGVGVAVSHPAGTRAVLRAFPAGRRALAMGVRQTAVTAGAMLAALLAPRLAQAVGWRAALSLSAVVVLLAVALALTALRGLEEAPASGAQTVPVRALLRHRGIVVASLLSALLATAQFCVTAYLVLDVRERFRLAVTTAAGLLALANLTSIPARIVLGAVSDRHGGGRAPLIGLLGLLSGVALAVLALLPAATPAILLLPVAMALGATVLGWTGLMATLIAEQAGPAAAATATGLQLTVLFGTVSLTPPLFGAVADAAGYRAAWLGLAALMLPAPFLARLVDER
jgi:MFS family permease